jgi:hypothetical protein
VILGEVGSADHKDFTAIGDTVKVFTVFNLEWRSPLRAKSIPLAIAAR